MEPPTKDTRVQAAARNTVELVAPRTTPSPHVSTDDPSSVGDTRGPTW